MCVDSETVIMTEMDEERNLTQIANEQWSPLTGIDVPVVTVPPGMSLIITNI